MPDIIIRKERPGDEASIHNVTARAFEREGEAELVDKLRISCPSSISYVALYDGQIVGHILFTPIVIQTKERQVWGMALGPLAILPEYQNQGIGSHLTIISLEGIRQAGHPFVIVLGHPDYYPRFGFEKASKYGITCQYAGVPDEAFMILVNNPQVLEGVSGIAKYLPEFDEVT